MCQFCTHRRTQCSGYNFVYLYFLSFSHYAWLRLLHLYSLSLSYIQVQAEIMKHMCNRGPYYRYRRYYRATFMDNSQCACRRREIPLQDNSEQRDSDDTNSCLLADPKSRFVRTCYCHWHVDDKGHLCRHFVRKSMNRTCVVENNLRRAQSCLWF